MMNIPAIDIPEWKLRMRQGLPSVVLREIAQRYSLGRNALGMVLPDLCDEISTPEIQAIWTWDFEKKGRGLTDEELNEALSVLKF
jgi:hypothetical protein